MTVFHPIYLNGFSGAPFIPRIKASGSWPNALQLLQDANLVALGGSVVASNTAVTWLSMVINGGILGGG